MMQTTMTIIAIGLIAIEFIACLIAIGFIAWLVYEVCTAPVIDEDDMFNNEHEEAVKVRYKDKNS